MADAIQRVKRDIAFNQLVIFIGTGVSAYTAGDEGETRHWNGLLKDGLQRCYQSESVTPKEWNNLHEKFDSRRVEVDDCLVAADRIKHCLSQDGRYDTWLRETIGNFSVRKPELIQAIGELGCPMVTTNYDSLLEDVLKKDALTWHKYDATHRGDSFEDLKNDILHLYGCIQEPESVVFSTTDFDQLLLNAFARSKLQALMNSKTLLFIGYGAEMFDPHFSRLLKWLRHRNRNAPPSMYKLVSRTSGVSFLENITEILYGNSADELLSLIKSLQSFTPIIRDSLLFTDRRAAIREKYLRYVIEEYGHVAIFGDFQTNINLPLESVYVELKFDPTHPSIKAMKTLEVTEEFKRKLFSYGFFTINEMQKLSRAIQERNEFSLGTVYRDLMVEQWLNVLLSNRAIFTDGEGASIKRKIDMLKRDVLAKSHLTEGRQYRIQQAYNEFKHFVILGHPGSGKTTISKWLVVNMAKQCLGEESMLGDCTEKLPVLIPIWKYVDRMKQSPNEQKKSLLQFIYENPTLDAASFTPDEQADLSSWLLSSLMQGNVLVIFEGLDEVPAHVDRADLMKEINALLERGIDYDMHTGKLSYSRCEQKEILGTKSPNVGNRFIITSRIEGNYFEDINFSIPRLTIESMSEDALKLFCRSYMECMRDCAIQTKVGKVDQLYEDITQNKDIFQLAINPQLASVIAAIYNQLEDKLPEKRIDLYEIAIAKMVDRLVHLSITDLELNAALLWSILQEIAAFLHSKVEGLSEKALKDIVRQCLMQHQIPAPQIESSISELVDMFKYQAGVLNEFGYDSFRFIHRTFQEYLAAKSMIYFQGSQRPEEMIVGNIRSKIGIPNWRVSLSMTFGILSKLPAQDGLFNRVLSKLLTNEHKSTDRQFSTLLVPFVIVDSLNDIYFPSTGTQSELMQKLADMLLADYNNQLGFSRLKDHQGLIHAYFLKLKKTHSRTLSRWFVGTMNDSECIAPCANILLQLKWYNPKLHLIFLKNLHNDSPTWNWPVDAVLRLYSKEASLNAASTPLQFKAAISQDRQLISDITQSSDWLRLVTMLYGGYKNYHTGESIAEYMELCQFLRLTDAERVPFVFYYQEIWDRTDTAYSMALRADAIETNKHWHDKPVFDAGEIYKESFLTSQLLQLLHDKKPPTNLIPDLRQEITNEKLSISERTEVFLALLILDGFESVTTIIQTEAEPFRQTLANRVEQLIDVIKDPIARFSSTIADYLLSAYQQMSENQFQSNLKFSDYCKIYLALVADSGGLPVNTKILAETITDADNKWNLYAEYYAFQLTGATDDFRHNAAVVADAFHTSGKVEQILQPFLRVSSAAQLYRPIRAHPWATDAFVFNSSVSDDIPIAFLNCLENIHTNVPYVIDVITNVFFKEGYFTRNSQLVPLVVLLHFGIMSKDLEPWKVYAQLLPELSEEIDIKDFLWKKIQCMDDPYYKSRALYQLAEFYDEKSQELLTESFRLTMTIQEPVLKFQVLEKIFHIAHYKVVQEKRLIQQTLDALVSTSDDVNDPYNQVIASVRLSFYGSGEFRWKHLTNAVEVLSKMKEDDDKVGLIIKLKPVMGIDSDLQMKLNRIIEGLQNKTSYHLINSYYGRILTSEQPKTSADHIELQALFQVVAQLNDAKVLLGKTQSIDQLWINLSRDPDNQSNLERILQVGFQNELFLTPLVTTVIDEVVQQGKEDAVSILFPYLIKPSNEVLPTIQRWFVADQSKPISQLAALLLAEAKHVFESAIDPLLELLRNDNDQLRYRAQRIFQHPERNPSKPSKRTSVIGEATMMKILLHISKREHLPRVRAYLASFFYDIHWNDPQVFQSLHRSVIQLKESNLTGERDAFFLNRIKFANHHTWNTVLRAAELSLRPSYMEELFHSTMTLIHNSQITADDWIEFARILSTTDTSHFKEQLYFTQRDVAIIDFIMDQILALTNVVDETYFAILESKIISEITVKMEDLPGNTYDEIKEIARCNFYAAVDFNQTVLGMLNHVSLTMVVMENLLRWLLHKLISFEDFGNTMFSCMLSNCLLTLASACVQKEDYLYRKITNSATFNKAQMIQLLERMLHRHPYFPARGNAFILLAALDHANHRVMINAMNALLDENVVKEYSVIGIPLIHLSPNEFVEDLLHSLNSDSAIKTYEILKIFTEFALNEKIDARSKSQIIDYLGKAIGQLKSKKPVSYYYTDVRIPFTTTLENELYKAWIKIQGLSGKTQYSVSTNAFT